MIIASKSCLPALALHFTYPCSMVVHFLPFGSVEALKLSWFIDRIFCPTPMIG